MLHLKKYKLKFEFCGAKPKLANFHTGKPFVNKLLQLARKVKTWHEKRLSFLNALTLRYIKKYRGAVPKLAKFDMGKPFVNKLVQYLEI